MAAGAGVGNGAGVGVAAGAGVGVGVGAAIVVVVVLVLVVVVVVLADAAAALVVVWAAGVAAEPVLVIFCAASQQVAAISNTIKTRGAFMVRVGKDYGEAGGGLAFGEGVEGGG